MKKDRFGFSAAVLMSIVGLGVSLVSTNQLLLASSSTRSMLTKSEWTNSASSLFGPLDEFVATRVCLIKRTHRDMNQSNSEILISHVSVCFCRNEDESERQVNRRQSEAQVAQSEDSWCAYSTSTRKKIGEEGNDEMLLFESFGGIFVG